MNILIRTLCALICCCFFQFSVSAQDYTQIEKPSFTASKLSLDPEIDGDVLNDDAWKGLDPLRDMTQMKPQYGQKSSEKTEIRVAYTETMFYVAVVCFDSDPQQIVVSDSRRDGNLSDDDSFMFIIDTYNDGQNGFLFGTNANAMEYDAQIDNEGKGNFSNNRQQGGVIGGTNLNWDATWTVKARIGDYGWSAEFAIPLRSLRFSAGNKQSWGINFQRNISKTNEVSFWSPLPISFDMKRVSLAGKVHGLELKNQGNLKVMPYALMQTVKDKSMSPSESDTDFDTGIDVKYSLTPSLTLDLTYNTDFAQVEADEQQVNLDRFNLFFPEKRAFFLENAAQFNVGTPGEIDLFFSRRIGIGNDGSLVPILGGARVSGKIGQTNVGLMSMFTDDVKSSGIEKKSYNVARVNHDFTESRSSLGGAFINRSGLGNNDGDHNSVFALDGKWGLGKKAQITGFVSKSNSPEIDSKDHAFKILANYNWNGWNINAGYTEVGEGFNPEVGFLQRSAFKKPEFLVFRAIRPTNWGGILEIRPHVSYRSYWNFNNELETSFLHIDNHWEWKNGFEVHTGINLTQEGVGEPFSLSNVTIPVGLYKHSELQLVYMTNATKKVSYSGRTIIGGYFGGDRISNSGTLKIRLGDKFNSSFILSHNKLNLPNGDINATISGARLSYSFTPHVFLQSLVQYNNISNITSVNARFGWLKNANSGLFVVLNIVKDDDLLDQLNNQRITVKYSHRFELMNK